MIYILQWQHTDLQDQVMASRLHLLRRRPDGRTLPITLQHRLHCFPGWHHQGPKEVPLGPDEDQPPHSDARVRWHWGGNPDHQEAQINLHAKYLQKNYRVYITVSSQQTRSRISHDPYNYSGREPLFTHSSGPAWLPLTPFLMSPTSPATALGSPSHPQLRTDLPDRSQVNQKIYLNKRQNVLTI